MGYEMLHRGVIDLETLEFLYRTVEIPQYWRDKLTQIAYTPYARVDVRRMHAMGVLSDAELIKAYTDIGYDHEHAEKMAEFTKLYNAQSEKDFSKSEILNSYTNGLITRDDAMYLLEEIKYPHAQAEFVLTLADFQQGLKEQNDMIQNVGREYENNLITELEARAKLGSLNQSATQIDILIKRWDLSKYEYQRRPSRSDLGRFLKKGIITQDDYEKEMQLLGYSEKYMEWYKNELNV